jgi:type VI secretion system secreted protein VgrG
MTMDDVQTSLAGGSSQAERLLAIDTPLGPDTVLLTKLEGEDVLSRCFVYRVTIATEQSDQAVQSLLGKPVTLWLDNHSPELRRPINGHVRRLIGHGTTSRGAKLYHLEVVPRLWFLTCSSDCRIFQNQTIPDIIQTIFKDQGLTNFEFRIIRDDYPRVEYCVQYRETAFNFVSRLMEHLGLFYWHEHSDNGHLLVIADRNAATAQCQPAEVTISPISGIGELQNLEADLTFRPGRWTLNDYDFQSPTKLLRVDSPTVLKVPLMANHEMYDFPGKFLNQDAGRWLTRRRMELEEAQQHRVFGIGRAPGFDPGRRFKVRMTRRGPETSYLLTEVRHCASDPVAETGDGTPPAYSNDFIAIPADAPFRPERLTPKPFARGLQTATVVGPPGENIHCDLFGRVRVQFHWDRRGQRNDKSSCWMRVSQTRAGSFYGSQVIPHVGHEVIVSYLEDDPDRPLITGTVPNALTMPPMTLPLHKNETIQRDHGDNKIVMNGKAGQERLSMISPRAVNLFASGQTARPLSAAAVPDLAGDCDPYDAGETSACPGPQGTGSDSDTRTGAKWEIGRSQDTSEVTQWRGGARLSPMPQPAARSFTSGRGAGSLSSSASFTEAGVTKGTGGDQGSGAGSLSSSASYNFKAGVTRGTGGDQGSGSSVTIDSFQDPVGLQELWQEWYGTTQSDIAVSSQLTDTNGKPIADQGTYGTQDGDPATSYLNWGSEGKINCLVLDNNNLWVNQNNNTWVNGDANTQINGHSWTTVGRPAHWSDNNTVVWGANTSEVMGDNTSLVVGTNQSVFAGPLNLTINVPAWVVTLNLTKSTTVDNFKVNVAEQEMKAVNTKIDTNVTRISAIEAVLSSGGTNISNIGTGIESAVTRISNHETQLHDTGITVYA